MNENIIKEKSFAFAVRIVRLYQELTEDKEEFVMSKQLLENGANVGAKIVRAIYAVTKQDFLHEMTIAQKDMNEAIYWLVLLKEANHITLQCFESMHTESIEIMEIIDSIIKKNQYQFDVN